ncbi:MAG TPA: cyclic peptide export ABC transporter [Pyrinomonadaceae bacterium]|jgi:putative pyoverdin transport system ATP-binding/permease protein|nr:cyclic peptide export ABC transporter [Pyrinomonadaceae bacterium]
MKLILFLIRYSPRSVGLAIVASAISGFSNVAMLSLLNTGLRSRGNVTARLVVSFFACCLFIPISRFVTEMMLTRIAQGALFDLRLRVSRQILSTPLRRLEEFGIRRLMTMLTDDIPVITSTFSMLSLLCINSAVVVCGLIYLGWLSLKVLGATLILMALIITMYQLAVLRAIGYYRQARLDGDVLFEHFRALTTGIKELKLHRRRRQTFINQVLSATANSARDNNRAGAAVYSLAASVGQGMMYSTIGIILFGIPLIWNFDSQILIGYTLTLVFIMTPLQIIMTQVPSIGRASVGLERINELGLKLSTSGVEEDARAIPPSLPVIDSLELCGVVHTYRREDEDTPFRLGPIEMTVARGELLFLTGGNGSGKTTLAKIIAGLYVPEAGEVRLNGETITESNREFYREHFSMVFSDFYLFSTLMGLEHPQLDQQAHDYLSTLQLSNKVKIKDGALSTLELSQGQRKRLALLTAYLEDRPIYIFDEWAADQDPQFKEIFYKKLLPELKLRNKAVVVISHDDHYYYVADRIIKLDYGQVDDVLNTSYLHATT